MKKTTNRLPQLRRHKRSKRAYARFNGREVWFGPWTHPARPEPQTQHAFDSYLAQWLARGRKPEEPEPTGEISVRKMIARYLAHAEEEQDANWHRNFGPRVALALGALESLYGLEAAADFRPLKLKALRMHLASAKRGDGEPKLCRRTINERLRIVRNAFEWAASEELIPAAVLEGLAATIKVVSRSKAGRGSRRVEPVERAVVEATLPHLSAPVAALVETMWWTGARPSELFGLRPCDLDRTGNVWTVEILEHKTAGKGRRRKLFFGPQAQAVLRPVLLRAEIRPLFSPRDAVAEMKRRKRGRRETPLYPSHVERYERECAKQPDQVVGEVYTAAALRKAVQRGVRSANRARREKGLEAVPMWTPYQLRHPAATRIRREHGVEAARVVLGHSSATMTEVYAEADLSAASRLAEQTG